MQYKVRSLPTKGVPNAIYFLLTNQNTVQQFITDEQGAYKLVIGGSPTINNTAGVTTVNGKTGTVTLNTDEIPEGVINKYYDSLKVIDDITGLNISIFNNDAGYLTVAGAAGAYEHTQGVPSDIWVIVHNLGYRPNVMTVDSTDREVKGSVQQDSNNQLTITFTAAFSGKAYLS